MRHDLDRSFGHLIRTGQSVNELRVQSGPFEGMVYPAAVASGSAFTPKILGTYEAELHDVVRQIIDYQPSVVLDIGCAEGYYAVGFATRLKNAKVIAFDINQNCQTLCGEMAKVNSVNQQIEIKGLCSKEDLEPLIGEKSVVISDCEGFELELFDRKTISKLRTTSFLIETHDFRRPFISKELSERFAETHRVTRVYSLSDFCRPQFFSSELTNHLDLASQVAWMAEDRPSPMVWLWCKPKKR
jgi:predicted RNA methylase